MAEMKKNYVERGNGIREKLRLVVLDEVVEFSGSGEFVENLPCEHGVYTGQMENGIKSGVGMLKLSDKTIYHGWWEDNFPYGKGTLIGVDFAYEGNFFHGTFHGYGEYRKKGYLYKGNWILNKREGLGEEISNNEVYKGGFRKGVRHGSGYLTRSTVKMKVKYVKGLISKAKIDETQENLEFSYRKKDIKSIIYKNIMTSFKISIKKQDLSEAKIKFRNTSPKLCFIKKEKNKATKLILNN